MDGHGVGRRDSGAYRVSDYPILDGALEIRARGFRAGALGPERTLCARRAGVATVREAPGEAAALVGKAVDEALADALERRNTFLLGPSTGNR